MYEENKKKNKKKKKKKKKRKKKVKVKQITYDEMPQVLEKVLNIIIITGVYIIFLISAQKHRLWVLVRTASSRRF